MSRLLMNLRHAPEDEVEEVRALLREHGIDFYETQAGRWRISLAGIWVEEQDYEAARRQFDAYQRERQVRVRAELARQRESGEAPGVIDSLRANPLGFGLALVVIIGIVVLMAWPYFGW
ncbi:DUF6164 family protein [Denitratimonas sp. CY0512]|uniref:DUF6164 family protein n=1 Tax=Denitratimonas sp. CY0512 TaxID=3131940 RepID=UPI00309BE2CD